METCFVSEKSESSESVSCLGATLCDPMNCSMPGSSIHGILRAGILTCFYFLTICCEHWCTRFCLEIGFQFSWIWF